MISVTPAPRLIVTADDFGLTVGVNRGIVTAVTDGIVTSASLMANGEAFEHAAALTLEHGLDVGVHLTLVEERPLLPPESLPSLVNGRGRLPGRFVALLQRLARGRIDLGEVRAELKAQIERCLGRGLVPSHLSSHQHVHLWPSLLRITIELAREYGIPWIRCPRLDLRTEWRSTAGGASGVRLAMAAVLSALARRAARHVEASALGTTHHFAGMLASGALDQRGLAVLVLGVRRGVTELVVHPGEEDAATVAAYGHWGFHWRDELTALTSPQTMAALVEGSVQLLSFGELAQSLSTPR